jgi:ATPase subunit of ABC transporter with duplicated ATPase domains
MSHSPIQLRQLGVEFASKVCFKNLSTNIHGQQRIGIIGRNGSGKSTLLRIIQGLIEPSSGSIVIPGDVVFAAVPQVIEAHFDSSGGERFNKALSFALAHQPNVLCLDEPTNHLDARNRRSLMQMLRNYNGTLIIVSHDPELLRTVVDSMWHIDNGEIQIFSGNYDDYLRESTAQRNAQSQHIEQLKKEKKKAREALDLEQKRAARSKRAHADENDRSLRELYKETGSRTAGKNKGKIGALQETINKALAENRMPEVIVPHFSLSAGVFSPNKTIVSISDGACGYETPIVKDISLLIKARERIALSGANGSGKTTLIKAILGDKQVVRSGAWNMLPGHDIGYLDQHYSTLDNNSTVFEEIKKCRPAWQDKEIRRHLNSFFISQK